MDKTSGDALHLVYCYAGKGTTYENVRADFLLCYPQFQRSDFRIAAGTLMGSDIMNPSFFCGLTRLETESRALVESYLCTEAMLRENVTMDSSIIVGEGENEEEFIQIPLSAVLQTILMHLILSVQMKSSVYDKIANITPGTESTRFMSTAVQMAEKERLANNEHYTVKPCPV